MISSWEEKQAVAVACPLKGGYAPTALRKDYEQEKAETMAEVKYFYGG